MVTTSGTVQEAGEALCELGYPTLTSAVTETLPCNRPGFEGSGTAMSIPFGSAIVPNVGNEVTGLFVSGSPQPVRVTLPVAVPPSSTPGRLNPSVPVVDCAGTVRLT